MATAEREIEMKEGPLDMDSDDDCLKITESKEERLEKEDEVMQYTKETDCSGSSTNSLPGAVNPAFSKFKKPAAEDEEEDDLDGDEDNSESEALGLKTHGNMLQDLPEDNALYCHYCHVSSLSKKLAHCKNLSCRRGFCVRCLTSKYKFSKDVAKRLPTSTWKCPFCIRKCRCERCVEFFGFVPQAPVPRKIKIKVNQTHNEEEFKRRNQRIRNQIDFGLLNLETPAHQKIKKKRKDLKKVPLLACHTCDEKLFKRDSVVCCDTKCQKAFCFICFQKLRHNRRDFCDFKKVQKKKWTCFCCKNRCSCNSFDLFKVGERRKYSELEKFRQQMDSQEEVASYQDRVGRMDDMDIDSEILKSKRKMTEIDNFLIIPQDEEQERRVPEKIFQIEKQGTNNSTEQQPSLPLFEAIERNIHVPEKMRSMESLGEGRTLPMQTQPNFLYPFEMRNYGLNRNQMPMPLPPPYAQFPLPFNPQLAHMQRPMAGMAQMNQRIMQQTHPLFNNQIGGTLNPLPMNNMMPIGLNLRNGMTQHGGPVFGNGFMQPMVNEQHNIGMINNLRLPIPAPLLPTNGQMAQMQQLSQLNELNPMMRLNTLAQLPTLAPSAQPTPPTLPIRPIQSIPFPHHPSHLNLLNQTNQLHQLHQLHQPPSASSASSESSPQLGHPFFIIWFHAY